MDKSCCWACCNSLCVACRSLYARRSSPTGRPISTIPTRRPSWSKRELQFIANGAGLPSDPIRLTSQSYSVSRTDFFRK